MGRLFADIMKMPVWQKLLTGGAMKSFEVNGIAAKCVVVICLGTGLLAPLLAQESGDRKELNRVDLAGVPGMEVVSSMTEYKPGEVVGRHFHHGIEAGYFVQGAMVQSPGKEPMKISTGAPLMNERGVPHAGFKVVGDLPLKIYTVHIVDKGKPLYEWVENK
jgi:quercetin dioxygenase-like cupin family protein